MPSIFDPDYPRDRFLKYLEEVGKTEEEARRENAEFKKRMEEVLDREAKQEPIEYTHPDVARRFNSDVGFEIVRGNKKR
jgi:hypothetical protein